MDITIYVQSWQGNGYYPTECFTRINGVWSWGMNKINGKGENYFNMHESNQGDSYFWYLLDNNHYCVFSTTPIYSAYYMHKGDLTKENVKQLIFGDNISPTRV
jgi:hypothetical protein